MVDAEISRAFAHPIERARAMQGDGVVPDRISLRDHVVAVEIGAFQSERGVTQRLAFNVVVEVTPPEAPVDDDVDRILSYDLVTEAIAAELAARRFDLLETLAEGIAARLLAAPQALRVFVRIEKLDRGPGALGVEIVRARPERRLPEHKPPAEAPLLVLLGGEAAAAPALAGFLDLLEGAGMPVLLATGQPPAPAPTSPDPDAARQIALLAADQAAWMLAGADPRLSAVASRTEIDHALGHGKLAVWAPSRVILSAAAPPEHPERPLVRAGWLAETLGARALLLVDMPEPGQAPGAIRQVTARLDDPALPKLP